MRKKSQEELGTLVTREMKVMLQDEGLTKEQRFDVLAAVMFDTPIKNSLLASFAKSLKAGFEQVNSSRYRAIEREREWRKNHERRRRNAGYIDDNGTPCNSMSLHEHPCNSMSLHDGLKQNKTKQGISPYKPPKGGGRKVPKAVEPEDLFKSDSKRTTASGGPVLEYLCSCEADDPPQARQMTVAVAAELETREAFGRMRVNQRNLMRHLLPLAEKNSARLVDWWREVSHGLDAWTAAWKADDWQYAPGKITKWLADEKYLQPPRKKAATPESVGSGCGDCGAEIA